jgi:hypothetical protein
LKNGRGDSLDEDEDEGEIDEHADFSLLERLS